MKLAMTILASTMTLAMMGTVAALMVPADSEGEMPPPSHPCSRLCPPGHHVTRPCSPGTSDERVEQRREDAADAEAPCAPCPPRHYTQFWNSLERCRYCGPPCKERQRLVRECSPTHDRVCECEPGTFRLHEFCMQHSSCPAGQGVIVKGSPNEDTLCAPCPQGYFSPEISVDAACRPHTNCSSKGSVELLAGSSTHDALCMPCHQLRRPATRHRDAGLPGDNSAETPSSSPNLLPQPEGLCNAATLQFGASIRHLIPSCLGQHNNLANPEKAANVRKLLLKAAGRGGQQRHRSRKQGQKQRKRLEKHVQKLLLRACRRTSPSGSVRRSDSFRRRTPN